MHHGLQHLTHRRAILCTVRRALQELQRVAGGRVGQRHTALYQVEKGMVAKVLVEIGRFLRPACRLYIAVAGLVKDFDA